MLNSGNQYENLLNKLKNRKESFVIRKSGSMANITWKGRSYDYLTNNFDPKIANCCKSVLRDVRKFISNVEQSVGKTPNWHEFFNISEYKIQDRNSKYINSLNGDSKIITLDIIACYWNIAHNANFISDKTYKKYLNEKKCRLIAIGNLNKTTNIIFYVNGLPKNNINYKSNYEFIWSYICFKAYSIYNEIRKLIPVLQFKTDCIYIEGKYRDIAENYLKNQGFNVRIGYTDVNKLK